MTEAVPPMKQKAWQRRFQEKKQIVRRAAIEVFARLGYEASSINDIADAVDMKKSTLYHYINSKEELLAEIMEYVSIHADSVWAEVENLDVSPLQRLATYFHEHMTFYLNDPSLIKVSFYEWNKMNGEFFIEQKKRRVSYYFQVRRMIADCVNAGQIGQDINPTFAAHFIISSAIDAGSWYDCKRHGPIDYAVRTNIDLMLRMLTAPNPNFDYPTISANVNSRLKKQEV